MKRLLWRPLALASALLTMPAVAGAHEGKGFHPEKLWALVRTGLLMAAVFLIVMGGLWAYGRWRNPQRK